MRFGIIILLLSTALHVCGIDRMQFLHFDKSNGFPFSGVDHIMQDSYGYLWVSSSDGLARYDGYNFEVYNTQDKSNGLPSNRVFFTFETSNHDVLVATNLGLVVYDREKNNFRLLSYSCTVRLCEDNQKQVWIATFDGIDVRDVRSLNIKKSFFCETDKMIKRFVGITCDHYNRVWAITPADGIFIFDTKKNKFINQLDSKKIDIIKTNKLVGLQFDNFGKLWLRTSGNGLFCTDTVNFRTKTYQNSPSDVNTIGSNNIVDVYIDTRGDLWVCCQHGFLNRYNRQKDNFERYSPRIDNARFMNANSIYHISQDKIGNYWIGTQSNGMYCLSSLYNNFETYISFPNFESKSMYGQITSFAELDNGIIALASDGDGIKLYNPTNKTIREFENNKQLASKNIMHLYRREGFLWGSTWGGGVFRIDLKTMQVTNYLHDANNSNSLNFNNVVGLYASDTALMIGTYGDGISFFNYRKNSFSHKGNAKSPAFDSVVNNWVNDIRMDSHKNLWFSTCYGLCKMQNSQIKHYARTKSDRSINNFDVLSVYEDSRKQLWVLTSQGVDIYNYTHDDFDRVSEALALPSNCRSIIEDKQGFMWISTTDKIVRFSKNKKDVLIFDKNDGIVGGEFKPNSVFRASDGALYFGSTEGFMRFNPAKLKLETASPQLVFRNLSVNYVKQEPDSVYLNKSLESSDTLEYVYTDDVISIELAAILFGRVNKIDYAYSFESKDGPWLNLKKDRVISFAGLRPGTHRLTVKAIVEHGISTTKTLTIIVQPRWWMTWWFRILISLIIIFGIIRYVYWRLQKVREKNIILERLVRKRTKELEQANVTLTQQSETLREQSQSLQEQNNSLVESKLVIEMKNSQLEEALTMKDKLIGIIAHDFKNPLGSILGLSSLMKDHIETSTIQENKKYIDLILTSITKLSDQMITVLEWAQGQMQDMKAKPIEINIETIIDDAVSLVKESSMQKQITINTQLDYDSNALVDPRMMSTVVRNLLTNAIKFTPRSGIVTVIVQEYDLGIEISVVDNGIGMSKDAADSLFSKNNIETQYGTENEKGTGLGLQICKQFIEKNKGTISVRSTLGEGTVFSVSIPKGSQSANRKKTEKATDEQQSTNTKALTVDIEADKSQTVLIVDDDSTIVQILKALLEPYYTVITASDGNAGLNLARNMVPNLIVSDIQMPHVSGVELCKLLKSDVMTNHIPIMFITSLKDSNVEKLSYISGADDYMEKPFEKNLLLVKVAALLKNRKNLTDKGNAETAKPGIFDLPQSYDDAIINKVLAHIAANISDSELDINTIADAIGLSRTQLWRKFKSTTGRNLSDYLMDLRMQKAMVMLDSGKYKIAEIAYEVGFTSPSYFTKRFAERIGTSPTEYASKKNSK